jgi:maleylpyruvate isomerase
MHTWLQRGFDALEAQVAAAPYCSGLKVSMADVLLVPMVYNALRFNYDMAGRHPRLYAVWQACNELKPFIDAQPENQTDAINQAAP